MRQIHRVIAFKKTNVESSEAVYTSQAEIIHPGRGLMRFHILEVLNRQWAMI